MEVNGNQNYWAPNILQNIIFLVSRKKWEWTNNDMIYIFWVNYPSKTSLRPLMITGIEKKLKKPLKKTENGPGLQKEQSLRMVRQLVTNWVFFLVSMVTEFRTDRKFPSVWWKEFNVYSIRATDKTALQIRLKVWGRSLAQTKGKFNCRGSRWKREF